MKAALGVVANILKLGNRDHYLGLVIRMVLAGIKHYNLYQTWVNPTIGGKSAGLNPSCVVWETTVEVITVTTVILAKPKRKEYAKTQSLHQIV